MLIGSLQYLTLIRPDLPFAVNQLSQHLHSPTNANFQILKRFLRYVQGSSDLGLHITDGPSTLTTYSDSDWASDIHDHKSTSDYCSFLGPNLISWSSKKQIMIARSSPEVEYRAMALATAEIVWLHRILQDFNIPVLTSTSLFFNNLSALALTNNPKFYF